MVEMSVVYEGGFHCLATHGPSGATLPTDAPKDNLGKGEAFSPTDLATVALAACMVTTMAIAAKKKGLAINLTGAKARVVKHMTTEPPRRIAKIEVALEIATPAPSDDRVFLVETALNCPVALSLHPDVEVDVLFHWPES